jgi:Ca2+-binding RTX toxin-like protein
MVTRVGDKNSNNLNDTLEGTDGSDILSGLTFSDFLSGLGGDDILNGGTNPPGFVSFDFLDGGEGIDTVRILAQRDDGTHEFAALNFFVASNGTWVLNSFTPGANFNLQAVNTERLIFTGGNGDDTVNLTGFPLAPAGSPGAPYGGNLLNAGGADNADYLIADFSGPIGAPWTTANITYDTTVGNTIPGFGTIGGFEQISLKTGSGNDSIAAGRFIDSISTGAGNDIVDPGKHPPGFIAFDFVDGGPGRDTLRAYAPLDQADTYFYAGAIGDWSIGSSPSQLFIKAVGMERVDFHGGRGADTFDITGATGGAVNGGNAKTSIDHLIADFADYKGRIDYSVFDNGPHLPGFNIANVDRVTLATGSGHDQVVGLYHQDIINTGAGRDTINPRSKEVGGLGDAIDGGAGIDTLVIDVRSDPGAKYAGLAITATLHTITSNKDTVKVEADNMEVFEFQGGTGADNVTGGKFADLLVGNEGHDTLVGLAGNDQLDGWAGNDLLVGGFGRDELFGGFAGRDVFEFNSIKDSAVGANRDVITGMGGGADSVDKIDLSTIDADTTLAGNQFFTFIRAQAFHDMAGELRYANHILQADVNGDGAADFEVQVNQNVLSLANFFL